MHARKGVQVRSLDHCGCFQRCASDMRASAGRKPRPTADRALCVWALALRQCRSSSSASHCEAPSGCWQTPAVVVHAHRRSTQVWDRARRSCVRCVRQNRVARLGRSAPDLMTRSAPRQTRGFRGATADRALGMHACTEGHNFPKISSRSRNCTPICLPNNNGNQCVTGPEGANVCCTAP